MQRNQIPHSTISPKTIYMDIQDGVLIPKIADPSYFYQQNNFSQVLQDPYRANQLYLAPLLVKAIQQNNWQPKHNNYKSDIYSLGMCFLQAAIIDPCDDCYSYPEGRIRDDVIQNKFKIIQNNGFTIHYIDTLNLMLQNQEDIRPDFIQFSTIIDQNYAYFVSSTQESQAKFMRPETQTHMNVRFNDQSMVSNEYPPRPSQYIQRDYVQLQQTRSIDTQPSRFDTQPSRHIESKQSENIPLVLKRQQQIEFQAPHNQHLLEFQPPRHLEFQAPKQQLEFQPHSKQIDFQPLTTKQIEIQPHSIKQMEYQLPQSIKQAEFHPPKQMDYQLPQSIKQTEFHPPKQMEYLPPQSIKQLEFQPPKQMELQLNRYTREPPRQMEYQIYQNEVHSIKQAEIQQQGEWVGQGIPQPFMPFEATQQQTTSQKSQQSFELDYKISSTKNQYGMSQQKPFTSLNTSIPPFLQSDTCDSLSFVQYEQHERMSKVPAIDENTDPNLNDEELRATRKHEGKKKFKINNFQDPMKFSKLQPEPLNDFTNVYQNFRVNNYEASINKEKDGFSLPYDLPQQFQKENIYENYEQLNFKQLSTHQKVIEQYQNGSRYEGDKQNGMRQGLGKFYYQDGGLYDGGWKENRMHGKGTLYYATGQPAYEGDWYEDKFQGFGTLFNEQPVQLGGQFDYSDFDLVDDFWIKYQGEFNDDNKEGKGTLYLSNGEKFVGTFSKDFINGPGLFYCLNGRVIDGRWCNNKLIL